MDDRQDVYRRWEGATADLANGPLASFVPIHIDDNLRNTRKIAEAFRPFAGEHFTPRGSTGLPVRFVESATEDALDVAGDCVEALIEEGWANNQIALLTTKDRHPSTWTISSAVPQRSTGGTSTPTWLSFTAMFWASRAWNGQLLFFASTASRT